MKVLKSHCELLKSHCELIIANIEMLNTQKQIALLMKDSTITYTDERKRDITTDILMLEVEIQKLVNQIVKI